MARRNKELANIRCVMCEAQEDNDIQAELIVIFNNDRIPVCEVHAKLLIEDNLLGILDEKSD